jgi:alanine racemase
MLYGYYPSNETSESIALKPAMTIKSSILSIKEAATGTFVSYNLTYKTSRETKIAAVPVGYGDGYNRLLSNCGEIMVRGNRYPVVGTVCMDLVMLDLGRDCDAKVGDEVVLLGRQEDDEITIYELCEKLNTIPYEITCWLSARVPKIYSGNAGTEDLADVCEN